MVTAVVLINVERPMIKSVVKDVLAIDGVAEVYTVAGEFDLVAIIRVKNNVQLSKIVVDRMPHHIQGITHTKTLIALECHSEFDLDNLYNLN